MPACPSCGQDNPEGFRLCGMCGTALTAESVPREERKVVTVLFCDLVGFTQRAERLDPEDVRAVLAPYHARVRSELERRGGTVEKFIGDAVVALFGAPVAHEDDPERAVRAALAIRDFALEDGLELRVGITTGEALVSLAADAAGGEGMASGDVVNTAARLQSAAPVNGILVDETTYRATRSTISYQGADAVAAKGKTDPVAVWQALEARARLGVDVAHEARAALIGRDEELGVLRDALNRARQRHASQLVTLVGVPGIGKSRLVYELRRILEDEPELTTWRQGRCLAYGEGVTLWALGEMVKAQAGIHEQDPPAEAASKIRDAVESVLDDPTDRRWLEPHLLALLGLAPEAELGGDRRNEAFAAWRRFLEAMAEQRPLVLVFEDLHWADETLLDFVDELVDWVTDAPLLVVGTARPELLERRPGWGGGKLNATTLALAPLSNEETARLIAQRLEKPVLGADAQRALLERAGGNPLYAEQFVELYLERGSTDELPVPETLQGIIAARLDGLGEAEKGLLQDASVIGKVFWTSALRRDPGLATSTLHSLERKGFVRRQKRSSVEGETEFAFAHALVRDVAYGQIARPDRAEKHRRIAEWIEDLGRPEDHAEMLAHHWTTALELARASGTDATELGERARLALRDAGDRASALNAYAGAADYYEEALALWPAEDPARPDLLFRRAKALHIADDDRREHALEEARDALLAAGGVEPAAEAEVFLSQVLWYRGQRDASYARLERAQTLVADRDASRAKANVLCVSARNHMLAGNRDEALRIGQEALELAEKLALDELQAHALATVGSVKALHGEAAGTRDIERALEIAVSANSPIASSIGNNLGVAAWISGDLRRAEELYRESLRLAERFGDGAGLRWSRGNVLTAHFLLGRWDEAARAADDFILECESSPHYLEGAARGVRGAIRLARTDIAGALADFERELKLGRDAKDPQALLPALVDLAIGLGTLGQIEEARAFAQEAFEIARENVNMVSMLGRISHVAKDLGIREELRDLVEQAPNEGPLKEAALAAAAADFRRAADIAARMGARTAEARHRFSAAEELVEAGRRAEGEAELEKALVFFRSVGATLYIQRGEVLRAKTA